MATLAIIAISVAGGLQAVSAIQQGRAARTQAGFQEAIAERNARLAERQAEAEQQAAVEAAKIKSEEGKRLIARQRAGFAVSGVQIGIGSPLDLAVETATDVKAEELLILREGLISAAQRKGQADIFRLTGKAAKRKGKAASRAATLAAAGSILTTIGQVGTLKSASGKSISGFKGKTKVSPSAFRFAQGSNFP